MEFPVSTFESSMSPTPASDIPQLTISPADTTIKSEDRSTEDPEESSESKSPDEKKPTKKRKSWGQELPVPKTNLPPRKRAKTEDEKEQRRIERVLRNRAAAQTSRERKRLEVEKLEGQKHEIEQQNEMLIQRLAHMEAENNRLNDQVAQLSAEIRSSRGPSPQSMNEKPSPTLAPILFKQEGEEPSLHQLPIPDSPVEIPQDMKASELGESSDLTQHPAVSVGGLEESASLSPPLFDSRSNVQPDAANDDAAPLSDNDFHRLFYGDSSSEPDLSLFEGGLSIDVLAGGDSSAFAFDSLVDLDPDPVNLQDLETSISIPDQASQQAPSMQPGFGASTSRCDEQGIAAGS